MSKQTVKVPDLGGASEVEVIEICVAVGDTISQDQSLIVVESDKASMDIPSPVAGVIVSIAVADGATISEGDVVLEVELAGSDSSAEAPAEVPAQEAAVEAAPVVESAVESHQHLNLLQPLIQRVRPLLQCCLFTYLI